MTNTQIIELIKAYVNLCKKSIALQPKWMVSVANNILKANACGILAFVQMHMGSTLTVAEEMRPQIEAFMAEMPTDEMPDEIINQTNNFYILAIQHALTLENEIKETSMPKKANYK